MTGSIRKRVTVVAGFSALAVLLLASGAIVFLQRSALIGGIDDTLRQRADDIEALIEEDDLPRELVGPTTEGFIQVVDGDRVVAATPNLAAAARLTIPWSDQGDTLVTMKDLPIDDDSFRVLARPTAESTVIYVGSTFDVVGESSVALLGALALAIPVVLGALCWLTWWMVGRTLVPVEAIRAEVAEIGSVDLHRRVPLPGTLDEIEELARTMNQMLGRLQAFSDRQRQFVSDASHELRTPLTRLRSELELNLAEAVDLETRRPLESMLGDVAEMQGMVENLLYLARSDAGKGPTPGQPIDLDDVVLRETMRMAAQSRVRVDVSAVSAANLTGDEIGLTRAVRNLLDNAARHARSQVRVSLRESDGWAELTVEDDGPGIPASGADLVFERFGRLDDARGASSGGTGLGLAIAREIADSHGGDLALLNPGESGALFQMRLPLLLDHPA